MERFVITGGRKLSGEVEINGAKNAILPILAACLLTEEECVFEKVPLLEDVFVMCDVLRHYGAKICWHGSTLIVNTGNIESREAPDCLMKKLRASNLILGPLINRFPYVCIPFPGGCAIGSRPMNYHLAALLRLGADISDCGNCIRARASSLRGADICLDFPSVGATENLLMAAVKAHGNTVVRNAAREPEVCDLAGMLNSMGARIKGAGSDVISIEGVNTLHGTVYRVIPDRIELGTLMTAAAIAGGDVLFKNVDAAMSSAVIAKLRESGVIIREYDDSIRVMSRQRLKSMDIKTMPYPGFPTDMQPQFMALMSVANGTSVICESIFENRFKHADEMRRMGADIKIVGEAAVVRGKELLKGAHVEATDLRAGAALTLMGLYAEGETTVDNVAYIDRGYQSLEESLSAVGADIYRVSLDAALVKSPCLS